MNRDIYRRIANLETKGGEEIFNSEIKNIADVVSSARDYNEIDDALTKLNQFAFKRPNETFAIISGFIPKDDLDVKSYESSWGNIDGKTYADTLSTALEILNQIRYLKTKEIIKLYRDLYKKYDKDIGVGKKLNSNVSSISEYSYQVVQKIGISPQMEIIKVLHNRNILKNKDLDFYLEVAGHIANIEVTNQRMSDVYTLSLGWGVLNYSKVLATLRLEIIDKLIELMQETQSIRKKIDISDVLNKFVNHFLHDDSNIPDGTAKMLLKEKVHIFKFYEKYVANTLKKEGLLPLYLHIEESMGVDMGITSDKYESILTKIEAMLDSDELYDLFRTFVGDRMYFRKNRGNYKDTAAELKNQKQMVLSKIDSKNIFEYAAKFDRILSFESDVDDWKFHELRTFLLELAHTKAELAEKIISKKDYPNIFNQIGFFSIGFAKSEVGSEAFEMTLKLITKYKLTNSIPKLCIALEYRIHDDQFSPILTELASYTGRFKFLANENKRFLVGPILVLLILDFIKTNDEKLFISFLKNNKLFKSEIIDSISLNTHRFGDEKKIEFSENIKAELLKLLEEESSIDYKSERLLMQIMPKSASEYFAFFERRISRGSPGRKYKDTYRYQPVPYHIDKEFAEAIVSNDDYQETVLNVLHSLNIDWTFRDSEISELVRRLGHYRKTLQKYIETIDNDESIRKLLNFFSGSDPVSIDLVMAIISKTSNEELWSSAYSLLYSTGVVSGEYGLANAHRDKMNQIKKDYLNDKNDNIRGFSKMAIKFLDASIEDEIRRTDERNKLMKIDFDNNK